MSDAPLIPEKLRHFQPPKWWKRVALVLCALPLLYIVPLIVAFIRNEPPESVSYLGREPIKAAEHFTGEWTLRFLMFTLAVTPIRQLLGWNWLSRYRRMFGVHAFAYAMVHFAIYVVLDLELVWGDVGREIVKRPYLVVGALALLIMTPLAITSTAGMVKRLGGKRWSKLHKWVYAVVVLGCIHFFMSVKKDIEDPMIFAAIFAALLAYRFWIDTSTWHAVRHRLLGVRAAA